MSLSRNLNFWWPKRHEMTWIPLNLIFIHYFSVRCHWFLLAVCHPGLLFSTGNSTHESSSSSLLFDSAGLLIFDSRIAVHKGAHMKIFTIVLDFLFHEWQSKHIANSQRRNKAYCPFPIPPAATCKCINVPQQVNSSDSGIYLLLFAHSILFDKQLQFDFITMQALFDKRKEVAELCQKYSVKLTDENLRLPFLF
jgi:Ulp1 family protease